MHISGIKALKPRKNSPYLQGFYTPLFPQKYLGNSKEIIFRSSLEKIMFIILDLDNKVIAWNSEKIAIQYYYPVDKRVHTYFPDVWFKKAMGNKVETIVGEIKAKTFTINPKIPENASSKTKRSYLKKKAIYIKNLAKNQALEAYCKKNGFLAKLFTEDFFNKYPLETVEKHYDTVRLKLKYLNEAKHISNKNL